MMFIVYGAFVIFGFVALVLQVMAYKTRPSVSEGNNPQFLKFQRGYFAAYLMAMFADWLQGPYLYKLYSYYGFQEEQIAVLYVFGFASTVIIGMWAPLAADQFGRKKLCLSFTVLYSLSCLMKLSRSYGILILGRIIGGVATSVLFSAFEAWYVHEHIETHDFPKEWIAVTFAKASTWNGVLAVTAGIITNFVSEWFHMGPVAPYMLAIPFLIFAGILVSTHWIENYSGSKVKFKKVCSDGFKGIMSSEMIFMVGAIEALVESVIYIIIFLWTPILEPGQPSLGIVFSCFMVCILAGQGLFQILSSKNIEVPILLLSSCGIALLANLICVNSTDPENRNTNLSFIALCIFQFAVGIYFPAMGYLRSHIIPEQHRWSIMNWFRVPINLISCIVLMLLHEDMFKHGNRMIFVICSGLLTLSLLCGVRFFKLAKEDESLKQTSPLMTRCNSWIQICALACTMTRATHNCLKNFGLDCTSSQFCAAPGQGSPKSQFKCYDCPCNIVPDECRLSDSGEVYCDCSASTGFTGEFCNQDADECSPTNPCPTGYDCQNQSPGYCCVPSAA